MACSKTELFDTCLQDQAHLFKALGHPARLQILHLLASTSTCITGDISDELPLGRTTVNQHLKELKAAGLIQGQTQGVKTKYCLNPAGVEQLHAAMQAFQKQIQLDISHKCE